MTDFTIGWELLPEFEPSNHTRRHWVHPETPIVIRQCRKGYYFLYHDRNGYTCICWFFEDMESAAREVQAVMNGPKPTQEELF